MPHRDFDAARQERLRQRDPITFGLAGETFTCLAQIPVGEAFDLADAPEPAQNLLEATRAYSTFILNALIPEDRPRWEAALRDPANPVDATAVVEVFDFVAEAYSGRPTEPSSDSSSGRPTTGDPSNSEPSEPDSGYSPTSTSELHSVGSTA